MLAEVPALHPQATTAPAVQTTSTAITDSVIPVPPTPTYTLNREEIESMLAAASACGMTSVASTTPSSGSALMASQGK